MKKTITKKASFWFLVCIDAILLVGVLFIASFVRLGGAIYLPWAITAISLIQTGTFLLSPILIMTVLCIPIGLLFDILWKDRPQKLLHAFLLPLVVMLVHHIMISWIDSEWCFQIDITLGFGVGTMVGCSLHNVVAAARTNRQAIKAGTLSRMMLFVQHVCHWMVLAVITVLVFGLTILQLLCPYGVVRDNRLSYPLDTRALCEAVDLPPQAPVYRAEEIDEVALTQQLADIFNCNNITIRRGFDAGWSTQPESAIYIDTGLRDFGWYYLSGLAAVPRSVSMSDEECEKWVKQTLSPLLLEDEVFETIVFRRIMAHNYGAEMELKIINVGSLSEYNYKNNNIYVRLDENGFDFIHYNVQRMERAEDVATLPVAYIMGYGSMPIADAIDDYGRDFTITSVEQEYSYYQVHKCLVPAYKISGTYRDAYGDERQWETTIDAVDRGVIPYIIPGIVLLIILAGVVLSICNKKRRTDTPPKGDGTMTDKVGTVPSSMDAAADARDDVIS